MPTEKPKPRNWWLMINKTSGRCTAPPSERTLNTDRWTTIAKEKLAVVHVREVLGGDD